MSPLAARSRSRRTASFASRARGSVANRPERRDHRLLAVAPVGIFETDAHGSCLFVNDRWRAFTGLDLSESLGWGWLEGVHPDDRPMVLAEWSAAVRERRDFQLEYRLRRPDGTTTWVAGSATPIRGPDDSLSGHLGTVTDITEAVHARRQLADERLFLDTVLDIAGSLVCVLDPEGRILRFNRACELLTGYTFEEVRGRPFYDFLMQPSEIEQVRTALGAIRPGEPPAASENTWVTRDGRLRLIAWLDTCFFDEAGGLTQIVSTGTDITEARRAEEALRGIEAIGSLLARAGPTAEAVTAVVRALSDRMGYPYVALFLREGAQLRLHAQVGYENVPELYDPNTGLAGRALRTGDGVLVLDVSRDRDYVLQSAAVTSEIAVPLAGQERGLGVLSISSTAETPLTQDDLRLASTVAERLSAAWILGQEQQALAERARIFASLTGFARTANSILRSETLAPTLLDAIADVVPGDTLWLLGLDRETGRYLVRAVRGEVDQQAVGLEVRLGEGAASSSPAMASRTVFVNRVKRDEYPEAVRPFVVADSLSMAAVPLVHDGVVLGAIGIGRTSEADPAFSELEVEAMTLLGAQTALALANNRLLEEISELAIRDALTGLFNRRHFDAAADLILARHRRDRDAATPLAAIMFDLDNFGRFNKDHGHQAGDAVLREFAGVLLERFRSSDLVARYGGEEFVAILEGARLDDAVRVAEEVRGELERRMIGGMDGRPPLHATVSAGCTAYDPADPTREGLLRVADVALFMAKRAGRNRVVAA
jgi:diguanylate cyclase (GGDEF)-like protein/PAS domain S-box-containing protein